MQTPPRSVTLAWTGASGMRYGVRLLECLLLADIDVHLLVSSTAQIVIKQELDLALPTRAHELAEFLTAHFAARDGQLHVYGREEWFAPVASGSNPADAMVVCPCTMGSLAAIAQGLADNLIARAADVMLKEQHKLILVPRETPYSTLHLENMLKLARMGVVILPPNPGFYQHPQSIDDLIDFVVARILDQLHIPHKLMPRWGEKP
ncbi:MAG: UbiX family flavin prenyltransferase [Sulfuriferula sp.]|nr:UbiX family flavin prenyltransferase [Sulfuriferula sp.]